MTGAAQNVRASKLLQSWVEHVQQSLLSEICQSLFGIGRLLAMKDRQEFVQFQVFFDYNYQAFLPVDELAIVSSSDFEEPAVGLVAELYEKGIKKRLFGKKEDMFLVQVLFEEQQRFVMIRIPDHQEVAEPEKADDCILNMLRGVDFPFLSKQCDVWPEWQQENIKKVVHAVCQSVDFPMFLVYALRVTSTCQRHKTHVVVIHVSTGSGLGEITGLRSFDIMTVEEAIMLVAETGISDELMQYYQTNLFDLEHSPTLHERKQQKPNSVLMPVVYIGSPIVYVDGNFTDVSLNIPLYSAHTCDVKAQSCFKKLRELELPSVKSPTLL